jgi:hypothetical protein
MPNQWLIVELIIKIVMGVNQQGPCQEILSGSSQHLLICV